jgi:hypothetical protein
MRVLKGMFKQTADLTRPTRRAETPLSASKAGISAEPKRYISSFA